MRVKEMADLAGTTTRTVRHYHALGLLPVPEKRGFQRDYGLGHLSRLMRIRWLADSGLALDTIKDILDADQSRGLDATIADLEATRDEMDARIAQLRHQRQRISTLLTRAHAGEDIGATLPSILETFYEDLEKRLTRPGALQLLRDKRNVGAFLITYGLFPTTGLALFLDEFDEDERTLCADLIDRFDALADFDPSDPHTEAEAEAIARDTWTLMVDHAQSGADLMRLLPGGKLAGSVWAHVSALIPFAFRNHQQRSAIASLLARAATDPVFAPVLDDSLKKEWTHDTTTH